MKKIINIYKPIGLTPLQLIEEFRSEFPEYKNEKIGFAGRLDPMANGVMLLMIGEETKNRDTYLGLDKEYEFEVLFGVSTDTYDALGITNNLTIQQFNNLDLSSINLEKRIKQFINKKIGKHHQPYPPFSSIEVAGKPLFQWARENKLSKIKIPKKEIEIYKFNLLEIKESNPEEIKNRIFENVSKVNGDFRQEEILKDWEQFFSYYNNGEMEQWSNFPIAKFRISCSSGTYVRSLVNELGGRIGCGAIAIDILRTMVGDFELENSLHVRS